MAIRARVSYSTEVTDATATLGIENSDGSNATCQNFSFNFVPSRRFGLLPPVTKYISPAFDDGVFVLIEQKPQKYGEYNAPWNYFLLRNTEYVWDFCWFFRPEQLYTSDDPLYLSWLTRDKVSDKVDVETYFKNNAIVICEVNADKVPNPLTSILEGAKDIVTEKLKSDELTDFVGIKDYTRLYGRKLEDFDSLTIENVIKTMGEPQLSIDHVHELATQWATNSVLTLSEVFERIR